MLNDSQLEQNKAIYRRYMEEGFNKGNLAIIDELLSPDYVYHEAPPGTPAGREGIKSVITMFRAAFPDLEITFEEQIAERDLVCSRTVMRGTHQAEIFGFPPTGKKVEMAGMVMVRVVDGLITDSWVKNDTMGLMKQLGMRP